MSSCYSDDEIRRLFDDDLDPALAKAMEEHIQVCSRCASRWDEIGRETSATAGVMVEALAEFDGAFPDVPGFEIQKKLGRGAMGVVYLARKAGQPRLLALKLMPKSAFPSDGPDDLRRWNREARAVSSVRHVNIVTLYDYGEAGGWFYLAFEFVPGGPLSKRLSRAPMPPRIAADLVRKTAAAVEHIHAEGYLHLDLKPSNILLDGPPGAPWDQVVPKVSDFGLSLSLEELATPGASLSVPRGTPSYMAPEQTGGRHAAIGPAADIHALGAMLYRLLTGRAPFFAPTVHDTMAMVNDQPPERPRRLNHGIPRDLETIILTCMEKEPTRRYPSAQAVADELSRWLDGRPILARPVPLIERAARLCRRNPVVASLGLALVLTFTAGFGGVVQALRRERIARQAAEQNLDVSHTVISQLGDLVLRSYRFHGTLDEREKEEIMELLREQFKKTETTGIPIPRMLNVMSQIEHAIIFRYRATGRFQEARELNGERIELARRAFSAEPTNLGYRAEFTRALIVAGELENMFERPTSVIEQYDRAARLLLAHPGVGAEPGTLHPGWWSNALELSLDYLRLTDAHADLQRSRSWNEALAAHLEIACGTGGVSPERVEVLMIRACLLADRGDWTAARTMVAKACSKNLVQKNEAASQIQFKTMSVDSWFQRDLQQWSSDASVPSAHLDSPETEAERLYLRLAGVLNSFRAEGTSFKPGFLRVEHEFASLGTTQRRANQLDRAMWTAQVLRLLSERLVRELPNDPMRHRLLSEAFNQEAKNAMKRDDLPAIRRSLVASLAAIRRAIELDPADEYLREQVLHRVQRVAAYADP